MNRIDIDNALYILEFQLERNKFNIFDIQKRCYNFQLLIDNPKHNLYDEFQFNYYKEKLDLCLLQNKRDIEQFKYLQELNNAGRKHIQCMTNLIND